MNNPIRATLQEYVEVRFLRKFINKSDVGNVLEIGCGNGHGTKLINRYFSPKNIQAVDLDEKMIAIAQKRNKNSKITFTVMDATNLKFPDHHFDTVFDFGIIHHIPNWKDCITELKRVLKPNGIIILEELSIETFSTFLGKIIRKLTVHPYNEMYSTDKFSNALKEAGFTIQIMRKMYPLRLIKYFVLIAEKK
jgi:ubiquinone/menaquinone biosynthesis C-methylase UbiE